MFECDRAPPWIGSGVGGWVMCVVERASRSSSLIVPRGRDISNFSQFIARTTRLANGGTGGYLDASERPWRCKANWSSG